MSTSARGASATPTTFLSLPRDVHLTILHRLSPANLSRFSQLSRAAHALVCAPSLWSSLSLRHFAHVPAHPSPASVSAMARALVHRWWIVTGAFVSDVHVHFRRGFVDIRDRGGVVRVVGWGGRSAYVIGGKYAEEAVPASVPGIGMDFYLNVQGPFPMDGMVVSVLYAVEGEEESNVVGLPKGMRTGQGWVGIKLRVNGEVVEDVRLAPTDRFETWDVNVPAHMLRTKPRVNSVDVEVERGGVACWLQQVDVRPLILPAAHIDDEKRTFEVAERRKRRKEEQHMEQETQQEIDQETDQEIELGGEEEEEEEERGATRSPRRLARSGREMRGKGKQHDFIGRGRTALQKYHNRGKAWGYGHGNHARSPRGHHAAGRTMKGR